MLNHFLTTTTYQDALFRHYAPRIALDLNKPLRTEQDFENLWESLAETRSCNQMCGNIKAMRWFATNSTFEEQGAEFWVIKLLLRHWFNKGVPTPEDDAEVDPIEAFAKNPRKELAELRANSQGFELAEKLLTPWLHRNIRVYIWATRACWSWFSAETTTIAVARKLCLARVELQWHVAVQWQLNSNMAPHADPLRNNLRTHALVLVSGEVCLSSSECEVAAERCPVLH